MLNELSSLESKLNKILDFETNGLIIRSRCRWAEEGEKSTKYFCNLEKRTCEKKNIHRILSDDASVIISDPKTILDRISKFYENLYSQDVVTNQSDKFDDFLNPLDIPQLSEDDKINLETPITKNEIYKTITSMQLNKTPGYDGLPIEFYVVFWKDICDMLIDSFNFSLQNGILSLSQRNGIITLIPKKDKNPLEIKNYRPISLLTVDYKILAKTLANRLKLCLNNLIDSDQSGFLKGRNIGNNIRLLIDIIQFSESNDVPGAIVLLDIEKAFDCVNHNFLFEVLKRFNFGNKFIDWVRTFYADRKSYVINNGHLSGVIEMNRGIFQGCPISPYLFLLVIQTVSLAVKQNPNIKGIPVGDHIVKISMLADDTTCFLDGSKNSFQHLFDTFDKFASCSGCNLNLNKTEAIWIGSKKGILIFHLRTKV